MNAKDKSETARFPIVSLIIETDEGESQSRLFYAVEKRRGFVSVDDPADVYHESQTNGTFEEILANCLVTEH